MTEKAPNPFIDPNLTNDDIPEEDLLTLARLAGEAIRRETAELRAKGLLPPICPRARPAAALAKPETRG